jgi:hypothetical protein
VPFFNFPKQAKTASIESQYTFSKKANLGNKEYNTITPRGAVDTNRPRPDRYYGTA